MKCPYCKAELEGNPSEYGDYHESGYGIGTYWDEYLCICPECGKEFRWFENYIRVEDDTMKMEE